MVYVNKSRGIFLKYCCLAHIRLANWRHNISENRCCTYIIDARSFNWIFLRLFIYVMVVSATVRYGTSVSHISLPQTSVSVDSWVVKEKSKNYHNWTSSASHDVCAAPIFTYIMSGCGLIYEKWMCAKSEGRGMNGGIVRFTHNSALFRHLDLIEYSVLHYAVTQTNISYRQSCILCEMHLKFNRADS